MLDRKVYLLMGNDENTQKVSRAANKHGQPCHDYVNGMAEKFKRTWQSLGIDYSRFCQTSEGVHHDFCKKFAQRVMDNGYIYSKLYEGLYCAECEEFKQSVVNGQCELHPGIPLQSRKERNWFFAWSSFKDQLLQLYADKKIRIYPEHRQVEMVKFIENDLRDISISRQNQGWGIDVPWDDSQVLYVWFDALLNYLTFDGGNWPADVHVIGKDIVRFHGALLPAMIMAYNTNVMGETHANSLALPHTIFSHGFICKKTATGLTKFSKSGENLGPAGLVEAFGSDGYRYTFMKSANFADDGEYEFGIFAETYNADLVNKYGNLFSRVCRLGLTKLGGVIPGVPGLFTPGGNVYPPKLAMVSKWSEHMKKFEYRDALVLVMDIVDQTNKFLDEKKPWAEDALDVSGTLAVAARAVKVVAGMLGPVCPQTSKTVWDTLQYEGDPGFDKICVETIEGYVISNLPLTIDQNQVKDGKVPILFPRYKVKENG
jgi:methionyl-tRNA synthetase